MTALPTTIAARVWTFGDDINTDLMVPGPVVYASEELQKRAVFSASRPGWVDMVTPGDIMIVGRNFGTGSSRPAARSLRNVGIACLLAESTNGLFFRNAVNFGFLALDCPGVTAAFDEGDTAEVSIEALTARNSRTGTVLKLKPIPPHLLTMMQSGGVFPFLEKRGLIGPAQIAASTASRGSS